jgi:hypothetical protein
MHVCWWSFLAHKNYIFKMTSNEKVINIKVVRIIETSNFAFWIITIWVNMQLQKPKYQSSNYRIRYRSRLTWDDLRAQTRVPRLTTDGICPPASVDPRGSLDGHQDEVTWKNGEQESFCLFETNNFAADKILIWGRFYLQIWQIL